MRGAAGSRGFVGMLGRGGSEWTFGGGGWLCPDRGVGWNEDRGSAGGAMTLVEE